MVPSLTRVEFNQDFRPSQIDEALEQIRLNVAADYPQWEVSPERQGRFCVVGGGPSLADTLDTLRDYSGEPECCIVALNECADFLLSNGIEPWGQCFMEIEQWEPGFLTNPQEGLVYLVSSAAHPAAYERLSGCEILQWHPREDIGEDVIIREKYPAAPLVNGGTTAASRTLFMGHAMGYRKFDLFGLDSSVTQQSHTYKHVDDACFEFYCAGRTFLAPPYLARQADDFRQIFENLPEEFADLRVHGDGLLPHISKFFFKHSSQE